MIERISNSVYSVHLSFFIYIYIVLFISFEKNAEIIFSLNLLY